jgi:hypothetical protein
MRQAFRDRVQVSNAPVEEGYGGQSIRDWEQATTSEPIPAKVAPVSTPVEETDREQLTITSWRVELPLPLPAGALEPEAESRLLWEGKTLEVDGEVELHKHRGKRHHLEMVGRLVTYG